MTKRYVAKIMPLEPYTFGTEQGSVFQGAVNTGKESYIIMSSCIPEQTTLLGTLRYLVLANKGVLRSNFDYSEVDREAVEEAIGKESFSFANKEKQSFGLIKSLSPIYLMKGDEIYIKNPFCNNPKQPGYQPYKMGSHEVRTSYGKISLPENYIAKDGYGKGYIELANKKVVAEETIFQKTLCSGNRADNLSEQNKDGFFKREVVTMNPDYAFAVEVEAEENSLPEKAVAYMGRKKSAFLFEITETEKEQIESRVEAAFENMEDAWFYALSDIYVENYSADHFAIIQKKKIRNLETVMDSSTYIGKRRKSNRQLHLMEAGSVFKEPLVSEKIEEKYKAIGYNYIVKIGRNNG